MKLEPTKPETTEQFRALIAECNAPLPWAETEDGGIYDADGNFVLQIDPDNERPDIEVHKLAGWIVVGVNTLGGFKAVRQ